MRKLIIATALVAAACGKGAGGGASGGGTADPKAANDAVPAAWKQKLAFEVKTLGDDPKEKVSAAVPKGWKKGFLPDELDPPDNNNDFGFGTTFRVGGTCGGDCKAKSAKEWEDAANHAFFDNVLAHTPAPKVIKDDKKPGRRTMIAEDQHTDGNMNQTFVITAWWSDGGERFYFCDVALAEEAKDLAPAFDKACAAAVEQ